MSDITVEELARRRAADDAPMLVDIREPWEVKICALPDSKTIPMRTLAADPSLIPNDREVVLICHAGGRSDHLAAFLTAHGYGNARSLRGGLDAWAVHVDPTMERY